ncbi:MAG: long-chain-fatty-acid--CoA ligase [Pseudomonadota bacterium]
MKNNIGQFLAKRALLSPDLEGAIDHATGARYSFAELDRRANRVAHHARAAGITQGDRVALLQMNSVEFLDAFFGLAKLGAVVVPLNWRLVPDELEYILGNAGARMLIYGAEFAEQAAALHERETPIEMWIEVGPANTRQPFADHFDTVIETASDAAIESAAADEDTLFIMYTSGTTGLPKGVVHTHGTMTWALMSISSTADLRYRDRYVLALPMFHVGALTPILGNVYRGVTTVLMRQFDPVAMWRIIHDEQITTTLAVPAMLNFMLQVPDLDQFDYSRLRWIMSGATPVPVTLIERYAAMDIEIHQVYGLTECGGPGCLISPDDALQRIGSTGKAFFHADVRVIDKQGDDVAPGEPGEVIIRSPHNMIGYWNNPDATAETLRDGWLYTGDVALIDVDGFITIHDRIKDMVISGGENVYPAEIEDVVLAHPGVAEVAVIGQPSERWGESPFAVVVRADTALTEADVLKHCDSRLARFKLPKAVGFVESIPRNPTGKALKRLLREQFPGPAPE